MSKGKKATVAVGSAAVLALAAAIVKPWEGYEPTAYRDVIGVWTACYGHTQGIEPGKTYTREECTRFLEQDLAEAQGHVHRCIGRDMPVSVEVALISATYNVGPRIVCGSTLQRKAQAGDWKGACAELDRWVYAGGKKWRGLERRRAHEREFCEGGLT